MGNATYTAGGTPLDNPTNDAALVAAKLSSLGFQVTYGESASGVNTVNLGQTQMRNLIGAFMSTVRDGDLVLIYYAGHGVESDGQDYMLPVDVNLETPSAVKFQGISLESLEPDKATFGVIIVFDACRDNPFIRRVKGSVAGTHALSPRPGDLVMFAASSGDVADDSGAGSTKNGVFATALVNALNLPDASVSKIYQSTLREVRMQTSNRQAPQRFGDLADEFVFNPTNGAVQYAVAASPPARAPAPQAEGPYAVPALPVAQPVATQIATNDAPAPPTRSIVVSNKPVPDSVAANQPPPPVRPPATISSTASPDEPLAAKPAPSAVEAPVQKPILLAANDATSFNPAPGATGPTALPMAPVRGGQYTVASLGQDVAPEPPKLEVVPDLNLPASFCSAEARNSYISDIHQPAYMTALRNVDAANAYLVGLNKLTNEYNDHGGGFAFRLLDQFKKFQVISNNQQTLAKSILALDPKIREIPIGPCR